MGKRIKALREKVSPEKTYTVEEACKLLVETKSAKFDESVEIAINLGVDPKKADQNVRGSVSLPHGLGKKIRVAVFAKGDKAKEAEAAGADFVGSDELVAKIQGGFLDFDSIVATPDMMGAVGRVGKLLGPRGLMPSPKLGTVTFEVGETVKSLKAGRAEYRVEKAGIVQASIGKVSFGPQKIAENLQAMMQAIVKAKPSTSKGVYLKNACVSLTMGPGIKLDLGAYRS
jgi:large subunit ribosomal protein L1